MGKDGGNLEDLVTDSEVSEEENEDDGDDNNRVDSETATAAKQKTKITLTPEQIEHFRDAYNIFDKDGDGGVTVHELAHVMRCLGQDPSDAEVRRLFGEVDVDGSGEIDFDEFLVIMQNQIAASGGAARDSTEFTREDWAHAFNVFDLNQDGHITAEELGKVLGSMGENLKDYELKEMVQEVCTDGSEQLNLDMFIDVMVNGVRV